jgi:RsiW-degrading membrane proteinase PrsW (M82 family)
MLYSILVASLIPLGFLYLVHWLNFFETHQARWMYLALAWGVIAVELSYLVDHPLRLVLGMAFIAKHTAPLVEEVFKSMVLLFLVRRASTTFFVDGAVYGFAAGIGFAIAENMLYLSRVDIDTGVVIGTTRAFIASILHGSTTAIVGMMLAGFPLGRIHHVLARWVIGLAIAITIHTLYNDVAFHQFVFGHTGLLVLAAIAFSAFALVALAILWGLRRERLRLRRSLGAMPGASHGELHIIQRIDDLDDMLAPIRQRFGDAKCAEVAQALMLAAQLSMKQEQAKKSGDVELHDELNSQIKQLKHELKVQRHVVGMYVMSFVRSIVPKATWSMWAQLEQALASRPETGDSLWHSLDRRMAAGPRVIGSLVKVPR